MTTTGRRLPTLSNPSQDFKNAMKRRCRSLDGMEEDWGFLMLNADEIVTSVQEESDHVDDVMDEDEDNNNESSNGPTNADTFSAHFDVKDAPHTGRSIVENVDKIRETIEVDQHISSRSIAQELKIDHKTVLNHLRKVEIIKKLDVWVPHQLTPNNTMDRTSICEALAKRNEIDPFLKRMVTGDEKWITYDNIVRK
ncbi:histone-lysine N-methyltransferase SETMAR [Trichonephila clavipes]|nr:histone-lysine N-methyltransferase SETMAR [Trichonephila clavipes]